MDHLPYCGESRKDAERMVAAYVAALLTNGPDKLMTARLAYWQGVVKGCELMGERDGA